MRLLRAIAVLAAAPTLAETLPAEVTLESRSGGMVIEGTLLAFDGATWHLDTIYGPLAFDAGAMRCAGGDCPEAEPARLSISGAAVAGRVLIPALVAGYARDAGLDLARSAPDERTERFELTRDGAAVLRVDLRLSTTSEGIADLVVREADVALALRPVRPSERFLASDAGLGRIDDPRRLRILASGALVPVVSPANAVRSIAPDDVAAALAGDLRDWSDLGGAPGPIRLHLLEGHLGDAQWVEDRILGPAGLGPAEGAVRHPDEASLAEAVAADPAALGVLRAGQEGRARALGLAGACGAVIDAEPDTVARGDHPFAAPVWMLLPARRLPEPARDLLSWIAGPEAQPIVRRAGFSARGAQGLEMQGDRLARAILAAGEDVSLADLQRMLARLEGRERLAATFRFSDGGAALDAVSRDAALGLGARIARGDLAGRRLLLAGYTDGVGGAVANRRLSRRRAEAAREAVIEAALAAAPPVAGAAAPTPVSAAALTVRREDGDVVLEGRGGAVRLEVAGFGEASPLACDDTGWGRGINRRVEVWATR